MFNFGWGELVLIGIVALIAIGPKELPTVLRTLGQYMGKIRSMASEFQGQFQEALREAEVADLKKHADDLSSAVSDITNFDPVASTQHELEKSLESKPETSASEPSMAAGEPAVEESASVDPAPTEPVATAALPEISVPLPEAPEPVTEKDFAASEPSPPKPAAGSGA
jgi:sec-independent protein translocase protein TatB